MGLESDWKAAKKKFERAGGDKNFKTGFQPACKAFDAADKKRGLGEDADVKKVEKANKDLNKAFDKLVNICCGQRGRPPGPTAAWRPLPNGH